MIYTHSFTNPDSIIEKKVNFFADYFCFFASNINQIEDLTFNNPLLLCENLIFQIEHNFDKSPEYIKSILSHPFFNNEFHFLDNFNNYQDLKSDFHSINKISNKQIRNFLSSDLLFLSNLKKLHSNFKRNLFNISLKRIIFLLKENSANQTNYEEIRFQTTILVTELLLKGYHVRDLENIFNQIIQDKDSVGFDNQFLRFKNLYKKENKNEYFIVGINGLNLDEKTIIKYGDVKFYSALNKKNTYIVNCVKKDIFVKDFFNQNKAVGIVKIKYLNKEIGGVNAIKIVNRELIFINNRIGIKASVNPFSFIHTPNFETSPGHRWESGEYIILNKRELELLKNNNFTLLSNFNKGFNEHFLSFEYLYNNAVKSSEPNEIWHYLESLLKDFEKPPISEIISCVLITKLKEELLFKHNLYLYNTLFNSRDIFMISHDKQNQYHNYFKENSTLPLNEIESNYNNDFISFLIHKIRTIETNVDYLSVKNEYLRIFSDLKGQRNSILHEGLKNEKINISILEKSLNLISQFRQILIEKAKERKDLSFTELIVLLIQESKELLK